MIDPGRLKTRLTIEAPDESADDHGGVVRSYTTQAVVWASVTSVAALHNVSGDADGAIVRLKVILRSGFALTLRHRLVDNGKVYIIRGLRSRDDGRFIEVDAEYRQS